jgi:hypothetical protein
MFKTILQEKGKQKNNCVDSNYNNCCPKCKNQDELLSIRSIVGNFIPGDNWTFDGFLLK